MIYIGRSKEQYKAPKALKLRHLSLGALCIISIAHPSALLLKPLPIRRVVQYPEHNEELEDPSNNLANHLAAPDVNFASVKELWGIRYTSSLINYFGNAYFKK